MSSLAPKETAFDRIERYYLSSGDLSDKEREICDRWEMVFAIFCNTRHRMQTITKYMAVQERKGNQISQAQAYRDLAAAERLFTPLRKYTKEFIRLTVIESALRDIKEAEKRASYARSNSEWVSIMNIKHSAERRLTEASGISIDDPNLPDFSKLVPHVFNITVPDQMLNAFKTISKSGIIDLTNIQFDDATIIDEYETPMDDNTEEGF